MKWMPVGLAIIAVAAAFVGGHFYGDRVLAPFGTTTGPDDASAPATPEAPPPAAEPRDQPPAAEPPGADPGAAPDAGAAPAMPADPGDSAGALSGANLSEIPPRAFLGGSYGEGTITVSVARVQIGVVARPPAFLQTDERCRVMALTLSVASDKSPLRKARVNGSDITGEARALLQSVSSRDVIVISDIRVSCGWGFTGDAAPVVLSVI
jgi:hypothetical protein